MTRDSKIEVAAVNIRIQDVKNRDYTALIKTIFDNRTGYQVYGDSYVIITLFNEKSNTGVISKYTEVAIDGSWFDTAKLDVASSADVGKIVIPSTLKPNLSQFYFSLDPALHTIAFERYSDSKSLSLNAMRKFFDKAVFEERVRTRFGTVDVDIVNSHLAVLNLLDQPDIKEVRVTIRRPNADDVGDDLAAIIEERLREQGASEYEETLKAKGEKSINPNERTRKLATVAAENGDVVVKSLVNGVTLTQHAAKTPLIEAEKYKSDEAAWPHFVALARKLFAKVQSVRAQARG